MKNTKKKRKGMNYDEMRCPYCGSTVVYRNAEGIYRHNGADTMLYVCSRWPACDAYVRTKPGSKHPIGIMADSKLRSLRLDAHRNFDKLHETGLMTKEDAYIWLSELTCVPRSEAHIGCLGNYNCNLVIRESQKILERHGKC